MLDSFWDTLDYFVENHLSVIGICSALVAVIIGALFLQQRAGRGRDHNVVMQHVAEEGQDSSDEGSELTEEEDCGEDVEEDQAELSTEDSEVDEDDHERSDHSDVVNIGDAARNYEQDEHETPPRDPTTFYEHIPGEIKATEHKILRKKIEEVWTEADREREREVRRQQMEKILELMKGQPEEFGIDTIDDVKSQLKLYM